MRATRIFSGLTCLFTAKCRAIFPNNSYELLLYTLPYTTGKTNRRNLSLHTVKEVVYIYNTTMNSSWLSGCYSLELLYQIITECK